MKPLTVKNAVFMALNARTRNCKDGFILVDSYFHCVVGRLMADMQLTPGASPVKYHRKMRLMHNGIELRIAKKSHD